MTKLWHMPTMEGYSVLKRSELKRNKATKRKNFGGKTSVLKLEHW